MATPTTKELAGMIDHTVLKADAVAEAVDQVCAEAAEHHFCSVCVNPCWVSFCAERLRGTDVKVCTVIGFPLGATSTASKAFEAAQAVNDGADEVDMVINIGWVKDGQWDKVKADVAEVVKAAKEADSNTIVKVILETCLLTDEQVHKSCLVCKEAGADFVKTSTGFSTGGATPHHVSIMRAAVGPDVGVKASGGIRDHASAVAMVQAGANRLGCSSGLAIVKGGTSTSSY
eukprot:comp22890_c0_seq1/m.36179 comp22890_c0_seq1/g.36179  ORF comp22890_c0_seq1/g.36179 comp22890_c0_seq1/m.36179 type:complete len:231 (-) comp22890_c0_seq1:480-1172(-)